MLNSSVRELRAADAAQLGESWMNSKTVIKARRAAGAASISLLLLLIGTSAASAARECLTQPVSGATPSHGLIPFTVRNAALDAAIQHWTAQVPAHPTYKDWAKAKNKSTACNRVPNGIGGYNHHCNVRGTPCRDVN
jgi:hypothetical protein